MKNHESAIAVLEGKIMSHQERIAHDRLTIRFESGLSSTKHARLVRNIRSSYRVIASLRKTVEVLRELQPKAEASEV